MNIHQSEMIDVMYGIITSISRYSINMPPRIRLENFDDMQQLAMHVEGLRYTLSQMRRSIRLERLERVDLLMVKIADNATKLSQSDEFIKYLAHRTFKYRSPTSHSQPELPFIDSNLNEGAATTGEAIEYFIKIAHEFNGKAGDDTSINDTAKLRRIIPAQKIAPVQFEIKSGRLQIAHRPATAPIPNSDYAQSARTSLIESGERLLNQLRQSNCDPRLLDTVITLQEKLISCEDIIQLGLMNMGVDLAEKQFSEELPPIITAMLQSQTSGVGLYVSQFPDWQNFTEAAILVELHQNEIIKISEAATSIVEELEQSPDIVDHEVPKTIRALQLLIADPKRATKKAAFAVIRTIENLVAKIFSHGVNFIDETTTKTSKRASSILSHAMVYALLCLALNGATGMTVAVPKLADTAWMGNAAQIIKKQIDALSKELVE
ncbi:hypothetical protein F9K87_13310 [Brucella anthropi]|uniref:hypothetical protein n=1 Tax=Brucella anthropi TaxID=529 RepID=UPI00124DD393|nr:hypothetical protein [Brucella anthropi]KAB2796897.1 hypothetical protein F9K87_13310 [Brucella anthropi]